MSQDSKHRHKSTPTRIGEHSDLVTVLKALVDELARAISSVPTQPTTT